MADIAANKRLVTNFLERFIEGGIDAAATLLADDAVWMIPAKSRFGASLDRRQAIEAFRGTGEFFTGRMRFEIHGITAEGDRVAVEVENWVNLNSGGVFNNLYHFLFVIRDGRIAQVKEYFDTLYVSEALGK